MSYDFESADRVVMEIGAQREKKLEEFVEKISDDDCFDKAVDLLDMSKMHRIKFMQFAIDHKELLLRDEDYDQQAVDYLGKKMLDFMVYEVDDWGKDK